MLDTLKGPKREVVSPGSREQYIEAFNWMLLARTAEEKLASLWRAGKISGGVYLGKGQEAISAALGTMLKSGDIFGPLIRDQAGRLAFGESLIDVFRVHFGSRTGLSRGRDGNVHRGNPRRGYHAMISHLGSLISVVAGALLARRFKGNTSAIGATTIGDGGTSTGAFHEAINMAAVEKLPLVVVVVNNQYAYSTPNSRQFACHDLVDRAIGYGVEGHSLDGTDLSDCLEVLGYATERARAGYGPQMVVGSCLRLTGHAEHDDAFYMDKSLYHTPLGRDCLKVAESYLQERQWADAALLEDWRRNAKQQVEEAVADAQREPLADPSTETWCPYATQRIADALFGSMTITYLEAIREAQEKALRDDQRVYLYGQDVGTFGGAFKATKNLAKEFPGRILDAPISEDAMVGSAIGAAIEGMRPIVEMQFADFSVVGFNQIVNQAATLFWRTQVACPITIRLPSGGNPGSGPFHSQCLESLYSHFPGLVVMTPATVEDAYTMLLEAVEVDDPVIFCEHKYLYNRLKSDALPGTGLSYDTARVARFGRDVTIVAYSAMVHEALAAADQLRKEGIEAEIVDLRCVKPLDIKTVLASVARTARLLCVGESWPWGGVNAEVIASVATHGFHLLDAPPQRINSKDTPIPFHPSLWGVHKPSSQLIAAAARQLCEW